MNEWENEWENDEDIQHIDNPNDLMEYIQELGAENIGIINVKEVNSDQLQSNSLKYLHSELKSCQLHTIKPMNNLEKEIDVISVNDDFILYPDYIVWYKESEDLVLIVAREITRIKFQGKFSLN